MSAAWYEREITIPGHWAGGTASISIRLKIGMTRTASSAGERRTPGWNPFLEGAIAP
jgi:hypothetical protein